MTNSKRQKLIEISLEILLTEGINRLTIKNIAKKMGFVESAVYKYYSSKRDILLAIIAYTEEVCDGVIKKIAPLEGSPLEKLEAYFSEWNSIYVKKPHLIPILFSKELLRVDAEIPKQILAILQSQNDFLDGIISSAQQNGDLTDSVSTEYLRLFIMAPWALLIDSWFYSEMSFSLHDEAEKLYKATLNIVAQQA